MTSFLGVDPSIASTGVALLDDGGYRTWHLTTDADRPMPSRCAELAQDVEHLVHLAPELPALAVVERGFSGGRGPSGYTSGMACGALLVALWRCGVPALLVAPKVRAKLATGKGTADKVDVRDAAIARLGFIGKQADEIDALWLAVAAAALLDRNPYPLPALNLSVLAQYQDEAKQIAFFPL